MNERMIPIEPEDALVSCPDCGADPGQQCSDESGTEYASFVHVARSDRATTAGWYEIETLSIEDSL